MGKFDRYDGLIYLIPNEPFVLVFYSNPDALEEDIIVRCSKEQKVQGRRVLPIKTTISHIERLQAAIGEMDNESS